VGETRDFNQIDFVASERPTDKVHVHAVAARIRNRIESSGREVFFTLILEPGKHWADNSMQAMIIMLGVLGALSLLLSGFLVVNTITALLTQQVRQVGIMKAIGARADQVAGLYLTTVAIFGALALVVAVPLGALAARAMATYVGGLLNFEIALYQVSLRVLALEVTAGLIVPVAAALYPIIAGTRITVREAISTYGLGAGGGQSRLDRFAGRVRGLTRPLLLSLRNTFRRRGRLALTLTTLTLAGAIFIGITSVQRSLMGFMETLFRYWNYDVQVEFQRSYRVEQLQHQARSVPGVARVESWGFRSSQRVRPDGTESESIFLVTLPAATGMLQPILLGGRWLVPGDENALVVNTDLTKKEPDVRVGDEIVLKIGTRKSTWRVVGLVQGILAGPLAYANYPYASRVIHAYGRADRVQVVTDRHDGAYTARVARAIETQFRRAGLRLTSNQTTAELRKMVAAQFNVIIVFLMIMAVLLAVVGGLGLAGTMSINVLERTREIGVMRAIGASDRAVVQIVLVEGVLIGVLSWMAGAVLAYPLGLGLSNAVGQAFLNATPAYRYSLPGAALWLALVIVLAAVASFLPAWNASRLTIRDVLAYE
ncbi:MAG: ABC transporter permease, partial [Armatimonadetes bacterium]|nr:ABC transporter permease [Armatimonadota bacterium]